jgi:putative PIN family toxin of toxin-antitoxin system
MKTNGRYVFDVNVLVSALLFENSKPAQAFRAARTEGAILLAADVIVELRDVLSREKFDRYVAREKRDEFLVALVRELRLIEVDQEIRECRDPRDDKYLELAVCGNANCIVSGDGHLLEMDPFKGIRILKPADFVTWLDAHD